jgi:tyrosine-protein kinase Etk/Wzc
MRNEPTIAVESGSVFEPQLESTAAQTSHSAPGEVRLLGLLILLCRRKKLIVRATLAAAVLAVVVALFLRNRYTATASILPPQQSPSLASSLIGQMSALGPMAALAQKDLGLKNPNDLYVGMLRSRTAEDALIRRFDLLRVYHDKRMSSARRDLEKATSINLGKEGLVAITVEDRDPRRAFAIANAYVDELRQLTQDFAVTEAGQRRLFFERQLELAKNNMADAEQTLKQTEQKTGVIELDGQAKIIIESVVKLRAAIAAKEVELESMRLFSTEQNPDLMLAEQQLSGMREQLAQFERQGGSSERSSGKENLREQRVSPGSLPANDVPEAGLEYIRRLRDVKYAETIFELLSKQYEAARLDEARTAAVIQVLDPAIEPDRKSGPPRTLIVSIMTLAGFLASITYVLTAETLRRMRLNPEVEARWTILRNTLRTTESRSAFRIPL